jgi:hypothetical protein
MLYMMPHAKEIQRLKKSTVGSVKRRTARGASKQVERCRKQRDALSGRVALIQRRLLSGPRVSSTRAR